MDLSTNQEWLDWVESRPANVQALCRSHPPDRPYKVQDGSIPGWIVSYGEQEDGAATLQVQINSPFFPRTVFGLKPEDVVPWEGDVPDYAQFSMEHRDAYVEGGGAVPQDEAR